MDETAQIKIARIETNLSNLKEDITEIKNDLKSMRSSLENHSNQFTFIRSSWQTTALVAVIAWNVIKLFFGKT